MRKLICLLSLPLLLISQDMKSNSITVESSATVHVIADILYFNITLSVDNPDPKDVFAQHKVLEDKLLKLFTEFSIPDTSIQYSLLSIRKKNRKPDDKIFSSSQRVNIVFQGTSKYENFQVALLSNGFYEFRSGFGSSQIEKARKDGYKTALENAKRDATIIAETLGKEVGEIIDVSSRTNEFRQLDHSSAIRIASVQSLIEIEQTVAARTNLKVVFSLK